MPEEKNRLTIVMLIIGFSIQDENERWDMVSR